MKIHITKSRCGRLLSSDLRKGFFNPNKTVEEADQESHHRVRSLIGNNEVVDSIHASGAVAVEDEVFAESDGDNREIQDMTGRSDQPNQQEHRNTESTQTETYEDGNAAQEQVNQPREPLENTARRRKKINWPPSSKKLEWKQFEEDAMCILNVTLNGPVDKKLEVFSTILYNMGLDRFGTVEKKVHETTNHPSRRQQQIAEVRIELRRLTKLYKEAEEDERIGLGELREDARKRLMKLRSAESYRRNRKKRSRKRVEFISNPYQFTKTLLTEKSSGRLEAPKEDIEKHLKKVHSDPNREKPVENFRNLITAELPTVNFDESMPTIQEIRNIVKKARAGSAPGPNGIAYKVYKCCSGLLTMLWKLLRVIWRRRKVADTDRKAEGCFIPKEEESKSIDQFRTISLLNVELKIVMSVLAKRITSFWLSNGYIDTSVQKGGITGVSGCVEHTSVLTQLIKEVKENKGDLALIWLDLANAYGSMPHRIVELTLKTYHVPEDFCKMIKDYFDTFRIRFSVGDCETDWQRLERGIVTGCTLSVILFGGSMNMVIKSVEKESRGPTTKTGIKQPPNRAFMDDMTLSTKSVVEARWTLEELEEIITWAGMLFKPGKSRSMVIKKGKVDNSYKFKVNGQVIPTLTEKPVKCLGKWYRATLNDRQSVVETHNQLVEWMQNIDTTGLPGKYKLWIYQYGVLPRLLWPMLVYDMPLTAVEKMETLANKFIKQWLGIPRSFSTVGLFSTRSMLQLPLKSITDEFKVTKSRKVMMLEENKDLCVSQAGIEVQTGRKWKANEAVQEAQERLRHKDIVGNVCTGRQGIGVMTRASWAKANQKERSQLVQAEVRSRQEEDRQVKAAGMSKQGAWLNWESVMHRRITWNELMAMDKSSIKFLLKAVYDVLPSPANLCLWKLTPDPNCKLCNKPANLQHVLSGCKVALTDGRYRWRHDQVLRQIAHYIELAVKGNKKSNNKPMFINFVKEGQQRSGNKKLGLLSTASDWELRVDLQQQLKFPTEIVITTLRPDMILWSKSTRQVIMIELTVPWEENVQIAYERKRHKYQELSDDCREKGWKTWCFPVEVGCRGFAGQSLWKCSKQLGISSKGCREIVRMAEKQAEHASNWLWQKREEPWRSGPRQIEDVMESSDNQQARGNKTDQTEKNPARAKRVQLAQDERRIHNIQNVNPDTHFFLGKAMPFSNFHRCTFTVKLPEPYGERNMHSSEQLYMFRKAHYFYDKESCMKILNAPDAQATKRLGSNISNFDRDIWNRPKRDVMKEAIVRKFTDSRQRRTLAKVLLDSKPVLVEASPNDKEWGIGFTKEAGPTKPKAEWGAGENWLGKLLMYLKVYLRSRDSGESLVDDHGFHTIYEKVHQGQVFTYTRNMYVGRRPDKQEPFRVWLQQYMKK